jgi:hypothetical protein
MLWRFETNKELLEWYENNKDQQIMIAGYYGDHDSIKIEDLFKLFKLIMQQEFKELVELSELKLTGE